MIHLISILCQTDKFSKSNPITEKFSVLVGMSNPHQTKDDETVEDSLSSFPEHIIKQFESCIVPGTPRLKWDDIHGLEDAKRCIMESIILPSRFPVLFSRYRKVTNFLFFGPSGSGKSVLARSISSQVDSTFFSVCSSHFISGDEQNVRALFTLALNRAPSIIVFDDFISLISLDSSNERFRRLKSELILQLFKLPSLMTSISISEKMYEVPAILFIATTPRKKIFEANIAKLRMSHCISEEDMIYLAEHSRGFSGSDIVCMIRDCSMAPLREIPREQLATATPDAIRPINLGDFQNAFEHFHSSVSPDEVKSHDEFYAAFGTPYPNR
ncbi:AAA-domain-containing protein [Aduncisulcus paluster]|uniref:AAA-domain-containing protein n=1 Tax=Aduncisulcus paluster TaxID=2918883 RepID=A0ABQ5K4J4_9EUKA|nr:AAA-domain-containing protein [Aduncisulcus paluster]